MEQNSTNNESNETIEEFKGFHRVFVLFVVVFLIWAYYEGQIVGSKEFDAKIKAFNNGSTLVCHQMGSSILVSKETGWSVYKEKYFLKDGTLFDIHNNCTRDEN